MPSARVLKHVIDVHCHPTDSQIPEAVISSLPITICAMSTRQNDQVLVRNLATAYPHNVLPCFGHHPWFSHWISLNGEATSKDDHYRSLFLGKEGKGDPSDDQIAAFEKLLPSLPTPLPLAELLTDLRTNLEAFPSAMVGEVGLDRTCRVPFDYRLEHRELSPFKIPIDHQLAILEAQIDIAVHLQRNVSFHSVNAQKLTVDFMARMKARHGTTWNQISVDMHSCGLSPQMWQSIERAHPNLYLSLSTAINARSSSHKSLIAAASADRLLAESDIHEISQCLGRTWDMLCIIADVRGWEVEQEWDDDTGIPEDHWGVVRRVENNWKAFVSGNHNANGRQSRNVYSPM
ncbi:TatD DNase family Scn1 [Rickenella mellea]|uniref:TatD DNase family Scn1 n=1 Tax=Rickenella mellea TaxID=50990 RepID=A0A4Y7QKA2_9AGAM|nr:TatD DNase family Scn1 [Rickenella mellea]